MQNLEIFEKIEEDKTAQEPTIKEILAQGQHDYLLDSLLFTTQCEKTRDRVLPTAQIFGRPAGIEVYDAVYWDAGAKLIICDATETPQPTMCSTGGEAFLYYQVRGEKGEKLYYFAEVRKPTVERYHPGRLNNPTYYAIAVLDAIHRRRISPCIELHQPISTLLRQHLEKAKRSVQQTAYIDEFAEGLFLKTFCHDKDITSTDHSVRIFQAGQPAQNPLLYLPEMQTSLRFFDKTMLLLAITKITIFDYYVQASGEEIPGERARAFLAKAMQEIESAYQELIEAFELRKG